MDFTKQLQWTTKKPEQYWKRCCCDCCDEKQTKCYIYLHSAIVNGDKVDFWACGEDKHGGPHEVITAVAGEQCFGWVGRTINKPYSFRFTLPESLFVLLEQEMFRLQKEYYDV